VSELGERRRRERDLGEWRQSLINEPLQPPQGSAFVTGRISVRQPLAQQQGIAE